LILRSPEPRARIPGPIGQSRERDYRHLVHGVGCAREPSATEAYEGPCTPQHSMMRASHFYATAQGQRLLHARIWTRYQSNCITNCIRNSQPRISQSPNAAAWVFANCVRHAALMRHSHIRSAGNAGSVIGEIGPLSPRHRTPAISHWPEGVLPRETHTSQAPHPRSVPPQAPAHPRPLAAFTASKAAQIHTYQAFRCARPPRALCQDLRE